MIEEEYERNRLKREEYLKNNPPLEVPNVTSEDELPF